MYCMSISDRGLFIMSIIAIGDLMPGMKLAMALENCQGQVLISGGTILTERYIRLLKTWGIAEADIEGATPVEKDHLTLLDEETRDKIVREVNEKFPCEELDPVNCELKRATINTLAKFHQIKVHHHTRQQGRKSC